MFTDLQHPSESDDNRNIVASLEQDAVYASVSPGRFLASRFGTGTYFCLLLVSAAYYAEHIRELSSSPTMIKLAAMTATIIGCVDLFMATSKVLKEPSEPSK